MSRKRYCKNCGREVKKEDKTCPTCGWDFKTPLEHTIAGFYHYPNDVIFATLSIVTAFLPGPGIIFGVIGIVQGAKEYSKKVIIASSIGLAISIVSLVLWAYFGFKS